MKKILLLLIIISTFKITVTRAQVYKRIIGIDSIGYAANYPPHLHSGFRFTYPNSNVGNREEVRSLYVYYTFPNNFYQDCHLYSQFKFSALKDTMNPYNDTLHNLSRTNTVLSINNQHKVFMNNGRVSTYYDGYDTTSRFYYNSSGQLISEVYKKNNYGFQKVSYQYNSQSLLSIKDIEVKNSTDHYYTLYKYNNSSVMTEKTDSTISSGSTYITRYKYKQAGSVKIVSINNGSYSYDDSMYYASSGLLDSIKSSTTYGSRVYYYYDNSGYLDSVVYNSGWQKDVVKLYWETYTPNSTGINNKNLNTENRIAVYPNPSSGNFNIDLRTEASTMHIINSLGQTVKEIILHQGNNTIHGGDLPKGIYILFFGELNESKTIIIE